jgi:arylamine N-acetyltransferase
MIGFAAMNETETVSPFTLDTALLRRILTVLNVEAGAPSLATLDALVDAYVRRVPWESASRIARRAQTPRLSDCPRWPVTFWESALANGTGGTCFESNYAFFSLLRALDYDGYLTINNMGQTTACHTAIVIQLDGERWLVDVGMPLHVPVRLDPIDGASQRRSDFHTYRLLPEGNRRYRVERDRHPQPYCFTLVDRPVPEAIYRAATTADYGPYGLFLDRVIVTRVVDDCIWRFSSSDGPPYHLESFPPDGKTYHYLGQSLSEISGLVSNHFDLLKSIMDCALYQTDA